MGAGGRFDGLGDRLQPAGEEDDRLWHEGSRGPFEHLLRDGLLRADGEDGLDGAMLLSENEEELGRACQPGGVHARTHGQTRVLRQSRTGALDGCDRCEWRA